MHKDKVDQHILEFLRKDSRESFVEIGKKLKLSESAIRHRVKNMVTSMDEEGFGSCTNTGACEIDCPKEISIDNIIRLNKEFIKSTLS